jgi:outer membrane protein assembly factor BamB
VLFAANNAGRLYAVDAANPSVWAMFDTGNSQSRFLGSPAVSGTGDDDVVVAACTDGSLYAFRLADAANL